MMYLGQLWTSSDIYVADVPQNATGENIPVFPIPYGLNDKVPSIASYIKLKSTVSCIFDSS